MLRGEHKPLFSRSSKIESGTKYNATGRTKTAQKEQILRLLRGRDIFHINTGPSLTLFCTADEPYIYEPEYLCSCLKPHNSISIINEICNSNVYFI